MCACKSVHFSKLACVCVCVCKFIRMPKKVPKLYQTNSFSHRPGFNYAEFVPQSFNRSFTSLGLMQSVLLWLKQALSGKVQHKPAFSLRQSAIDTDPFNFTREKLVFAKQTKQSEDTAVLVYCYSWL